MKTFTYFFLYQAAVLQKPSPTSKIYILPYEPYTYLYLYLYLYISFNFFIEEEEREVSEKKEVWYRKK